MIATHKKPTPINLVRHCVVCGTKLGITVNPNKTYKGGHFFGKIATDKKKKAEYWECDNCYAG